MKASRSKASLPLPARRALAKLGEDISIARRRRRLSVSIMAERAFVGRNTITRVERGDPGVAIGIYATILFVLGMTEHLRDVASAAHDRLGLQLEEEQLPRRVRLPKVVP